MRWLRAFLLLVAGVPAAALLQPERCGLRSQPLAAVRRRPTKLKEWEVMSESRDRAGRKPKGGAGGAGKESAGRQRHDEDAADDDDGEATSSNAAAAAEVQGLVLERYGDRLLVELGDATSETPGELIVCCQKSRMADAAVVVGDLVSLILQPQQQPGISNNSSSSSSSISSTSASAGSDFQGVVTSHAPRRTLLQRPLPSGLGKSGQMKLIAANVDLVVAVVCAVPRVPASSLDRVLVAARAYGMNALVVLNKCDDHEGTAALRAELAHYPRLGYGVLEVSVRSGEGVDALRRALAGRTSVLVGQSGVGKSSLVNALLGPEEEGGEGGGEGGGGEGGEKSRGEGGGEGGGEGEGGAVVGAGRRRQRVGALVRGVGIGAHTTSSARLFRLPPLMPFSPTATSSSSTSSASISWAEAEGRGDGDSDSDNNDESQGEGTGEGKGSPRLSALIDSPGIRELGVWHLPAEALHAGFFEIAERAQRCRFRNCKHTAAAGSGGGGGSMGCAVLAAVEGGEISASRLAHWREFTGSA